MSAIINNGRSSRGSGRVSRGTAEKDPVAKSKISTYQASPELLAEVEERCRRKYGKLGGKTNTRNEKGRKH